LFHSNKFLITELTCCVSTGVQGISYTPDLHPSASVTKQYNLVPAKGDDLFGWWKVTAANDWV